MATAVKKNAEKINDFALIENISIFLFWKILHRESQYINSFGIYRLTAKIHVIEKWHEKIMNNILKRWLKKKNNRNRGLWSDDQYHAMYFARFMVELADLFLLWLHKLICYWFSSVLYSGAVITYSAVHNNGNWVFLVINY